jgi:hypothetical protein
MRSRRRLADWFGSGREEIAQLVVGTKSASRSWALEPTHRTVAASDAVGVHMRLSIQLGFDNVLKTHLLRPSNPNTLAFSKQPLSWTLALFTLDAVGGML